MTRRGAGIIALWLSALALSGLVVTRAHYVTDMSAFLPARPTPTQKLLVDQLRDGPAARLILCAIEGGDAAARARASRALAERLRQTPEFLSINNGDERSAQRDREFLFAHRYALSRAVSPQHFSAAGLHAAIQESLDDLASPGGLMLKGLLTHDPTGEMLQIAEQLQHGPGPRSIDGVWSSRNGDRAVLIAETRASGADTDGQAHAVNLIAHSFEAATSGAELHLRLTGPGVFAVEAREHIERAAARLSIVSAVLIVALLLLVYRSLSAVFLGLLPVVTGALAGVASVSLMFGVVHGVTLGFGITLIGEAVDYSVYFFIQSHRSADSTDGISRWRRAFWPTVRLGVLTSICGFASLLASEFPGLAQLGAYSISGLVAAALVTRFVLPQFVQHGLTVRDVAPVGRCLTRVLAHIRHPYRLAAFVFVTAGLGLYLHHGSIWNRELAALSPVPVAEQQFDADLRADLGAADVRELLIVSAADLQGALRAAEQAGQRLDRLVETGLLGGYDSPANFLPSLKLQQARRQSLPDSARLAQNLAIATTKLPLTAAQLLPFTQDVAAARAAPALQPKDLAGTSLASSYAALILHDGARWSALLPLHAPSASRSGEIDLPALRAALAQSMTRDAYLLDLKGESNALYSSYLSEAIRLSMAGLVAIVLLLAFALRSVERLLRVLLPLVLAVVCVAAMLVQSGTELTILHLVGMLLIIAVGSNYALFFDHRDAKTEPLTVAALAVANLCTVIGFGLLVFSQVPVLTAIGVTVAPGTLLALFFSALLTTRRTYA